MSWLNEDIPPSAAENIADTAPESDAMALYSGDLGQLPLLTRRALVQLLSGPALDGYHHSRLWPILLRDETVIRRHLAELFLELVIDVDLQVAFIRQADTGELEAPTLLRRVALTFIDSVLLLHLRQRLTQADAQNQRAGISIQEIIEYLSLYQHAESTDKAGFIKRIYASVEKIKKYSILRKMRGNQDRFEISPTLKLLFSAEEIQSLTKLYQQRATLEAK